MRSLDPTTARVILGWAMFFVVFVNAISWSIGWGYRKDGTPGREIERSFGWPASFYCDLWRSNGTREAPIGRFLPPYPVAPDSTYFVYCSGSLIALLLDVTVFACGTVLVSIWALARTHGAEGWMKLTGSALLAVIILIVIFGGRFSAHL